jgi:hypothetical protein
MFFWQHQMGWREALGFRGPQLPNKCQIAEQVSKKLPVQAIIE